MQTEAAFKSRLIGVLKQTQAVREDSEKGGCNRLNPPPHWQDPPLERKEGGREKERERERERERSLFVCVCVCVCER